jgi:hypothetical protein
MGFFSRSRGRHKITSTLRFHQFCDYFCSIRSGCRPQIAPQTVFKISGINILSISFFLSFTSMDQERDSLPVPMLTDRPTWFRFKVLKLGYGCFKIFLAYCTLNLHKLEQQNYKGVSLGLTQLNVHITTCDFTFQLLLSHFLILRIQGSHLCWM